MNSNHLNQKCLSCKSLIIKHYIIRDAETIMMYCAYNAQCILNNAISPLPIEKPIFNL